MKTSAPWNDITGNARNGLAARASVAGNGAKITLSHGVPYGIWLEVRRSGALAVVRPAIARFSVEFFALACRLAFDGGPGGS